ncbi:hypothetical protein BHM03_00061103 [Ensete ventricosum]|nr:hypothetical protein BHM03_00061103 [Ensete ventricosum]
MLIMMLLSYSKCCWFCVVDGESVWYSLACVCKIVQVKLKDLGRLGRGVRHHWVTAPQVGNSTKSAQVVGRVLQEGFRHGGVCSTVQLYVDRYFCRFPGPRSTRLASVSMVYLVGDTVYGATCDCRGPQVLDNPLGSPGVEVLSSSSWGMTPTDAKVLKALIDMRSCYNCNSIMTIQLLVEVQSCFSILREYELHISLPGQHPYDTFLDSFELSIDALEDMTEAWLVEARISLASRGTTHLASYFTVLYWFGGLTFYCCLVDMFDLLRVKGRSAGRTLNRPTPPPSTEVPVGATEKRLVVAREKHPTAMSEKYPGKGDSELPRKKKNVTMSKLRKKVAPGEASEQAHRTEGKKPTREVVESPNCPPTVRELCEEKELRSGVGPKAMAATELGAELEWLKATLRESDQYCKDLELAADSTRGELKDLQDLRCWLEDEVLMLA